MSHNNTTHSSPQGQIKPLTEQPNTHFLVIGGAGKSQIFTQITQPGLLNKLRIQKLQEQISRLEIATEALRRQLAQLQEAGS